MRAYFSHTIRGQKGKQATKEDMQRNCEKALAAAKKIREFMPKLDLYVPAEHEDFIQFAFDSKFLDETAILFIDCKILETRDIHIILVEDGWIGGGMGVEIEHSQKQHIPLYFIFGENKIKSIIEIIAKDFEA